MKWLDIPPVWLAGFIGLAYMIDKYDPWGLSLDHPITQLVAGVLIGGGILLMLLAVYEMRRQKTTVIPHLEASKLVQSGIFSRSRNPIYLGDVLVFGGFVLWFDVPTVLLFVPVFVWVLERRFIVPEENRLRRKFHADFARYCQKVRRWI